MKNKPQPKAKVVVEKLPGRGLRVHCVDKETQDSIHEAVSAYGLKTRCNESISFYLEVSQVYDTNEVAEYLATMLED